MLGWGVGAGVLRACFAVLLIGACSACSAFAVAVHRGVAVGFAWWVGAEWGGQGVCRWTTGQGGGSTREARADQRRRDAVGSGAERAAAAGGAPRRVGWWGVSQRGDAFACVLRGSHVGGACVLVGMCECASSRGGVTAGAQRALNAHHSSTAWPMRFSDVARRRLAARPATACFGAQRRGHADFVQTSSGETPSPGRAK